MATHILTTGYGRLSIDGLTKLVYKLGARLVDIRFNPRLEGSEFDILALRQAFGTSYLHLRHWGNVNSHQEGNVEIADWERGLRIIDAIPGRVLLMCQCPSFTSCHRRVIAEKLLAERKIRTLEISFGGPAGPPKASLFDVEPLA